MTTDTASGRAPCWMLVRADQDGRSLNPTHRLLHDIPDPDAWMRDGITLARACGYIEGAQLIAAIGHALGARP